MKTCKIEQSQRRHCAATVTAVVGLAAAGTAAYSASQQSKGIKDAQAQTQAGGQALYGSKFIPVPYKDRVATPESYARTIGPEILKTERDSLATNFAITDLVGTKNNAVRSLATNHAFGQTIRQEGKNILSMEKGQVPADVAASINRIVAENLGGAFDPTVPGGFAGGSGVSNDLARKLGLTSLDLMAKGMSLAPEWRKNVDSFIYKPQDAMKDFWQPVANTTLGATQVQVGRDAAEYVSANNIAQAQAAPDPAAAGSFQDSLKLMSLGNQATGNTGAALAGLVNSGAKLYSSYNTPAPAVTKRAALNPPASPYLSR